MRESKWSEVGEGEDRMNNALQRVSTASVNYFDISKPRSAQHGLGLRGS